MPLFLARPMARLTRALTIGSTPRLRTLSASPFEADGEWLDHWDFDLGGPLLADGACRIADLGNLPTKTKDGKGNRKLIETQTRKILARRRRAAHVWRR